MRRRQRAFEGNDVAQALRCRTRPLRQKIFSRSSFLQHFRNGILFGPLVVRTLARGDVELETLHCTSKVLVPGLPVAHDRVRW